MLTDLKVKVVGALNKAGLSGDVLAKALEAPKRAGHGHLALPVFSLAKEQKVAPPVLAEKLAQELPSHFEKDVIEKIVPVQGFVNFHFRNQYVQEILTRGVLDRNADFGIHKSGAGQTMVIDYSSPNVAKPMHIGHLRATVIGQAIVNLAKAQGFKVIGLNHLGDWGVQFGNLAWAYLHWGHEYPFAEQPFESLYQLYVRFHQAAETDTELAAKGAATFRRLEDGDPEITKVWRQVVDISLKEYDKLWKMLGVQHDLVRGESFYNDRMKPVEQKLESAGLLVESDGAMVVRLDDENMAPCLIRKTDGASLYATRDLASAIYRREDLKADLNLYVVGAEQTLHFRQVFSVLKRLGYGWSDTCHHVSFGMYRFKDNKMSSRSGKIILLSEVLEKAMNMVTEIIREKNPTLDDAATVARQVGVGAVIFNDLMNDRVKNVEFDWDKVLDFEGDSGPYVQYSYVRCQSLVNKYKKPILEKFTVALDSPTEVELCRHLLSFGDAVGSSFSHFKPHILASYLLDLCRLFGQFYNQQRILGEETDLESSRMTLVEAVRRTIEHGLRLLNIESPKSM